MEKILSVWVCSGYQAMAILWSGFENVVTEVTYDSDCFDPCHKRERETV